MRLGHRILKPGEAAKLMYDPYTDTSTPQCECVELGVGTRTQRCANHIGNNPTRCSDGVARCKRHSQLVSKAMLARRSHLPGEQKYFGRPL